MVKYPLLSLAQQQDLPELKHAEPLPVMFEDSTHQLWQCETADGNIILKVCDTNNVKNSSFWQGMSLLFDVQLPAQLGDFKHVYDFVNQNSPLVIPDYIASDSANKNKQQRPFILTKMRAGSMVEAKHIDDNMIKALAKHMGQLHSVQQTTWGKATKPEFDLNDWSRRVQNTLIVLAEKQNISAGLLDKALAQAKTITPDHVVAIMPDLRWDQFLHNDGVLTTLVDLDAFVYAPRELELVLLEYLLDSQQAEIFMQTYPHELTDLSSVRTTYRLLLFLMNVLGEQDINKWMNAASW